ncbi:MAG: hypothetical protein WCP26_13845 [Actinomycetes bacterium]
MATQRTAYVAVLAAAAMAACAAPAPPVPTLSSSASFTAASATSSTPIQSPSPTPSPTLTAAAITPTTVRKVSQTFFGLHPGLKAGVPAAVAGSYRLWDTGTMWGNLEPQKGGAFQWANFDATVNAGKSRGVRDFLMVLGMPAAWASSNPTKLSPFYTPKVSIAPPSSDYAWSRYVKAVATHAKTKFPTTTWSFEVWNEANLPSFYSGTAARLAKLTGLADIAVKSVNPAFKTVAASTTTRMGIASGSGFFPRYLSALKSVRGYKGRAWPIDAYAFHPYPSGTGTPADAAAAVALMRARITESGAPVRPLWNTEINYGIAGPGTNSDGSPKYPHTDIPGTKAADWLARTYLDSLRLGIDRVYWYAWSNGMTYLGIKTYYDTPATKALGNVRAWLAGATLTGCTGTRLHVCTATRVSGARTLAFSVAWTDSGKGYVKRGPITVCPAYGSCVKKPAGTITITTMPVKLG